jgi:hypothetical protein
MLIVVVLPAPLGPRRPTISLRLTSNEMRSTATFSPGLPQFSYGQNITHREGSAFHPIRPRASAIPARTAIPSFASIQVPRLQKSVGVAEPSSRLG